MSILPPTTPSLNPQFQGLKDLFFHSTRIVGISLFHTLLLGPLASYAEVYFPGLAPVFFFYHLGPLWLFFQVPETRRLCLSIVEWIKTDAPCIGLLGDIWGEAGQVGTYLVARVLMRYISLSVLKSLLKIEFYALLLSGSLILLWIYLERAKQAIFTAALFIAVLIPGLSVLAILQIPSALIYAFAYLQVHLSILYRQLWAPFILCGGMRDQSHHPAYSYNPLPTTRSIRLLRLHPRRSLELHCTLETHTLGHPSIPAYDTISYHWGPSTPTHSILLHSQHTTTHLLVPTNCFKVLCDRASLFQSRVVWIDFICINQQDAQEKGVQIPLMREIYSRARRTVAWVGDSLEAKLADNMVKRMFIDNASTPTREAGMQSLVEANSGKRDKEAEALRDMLKQPYFFRVWMIQEIAVAESVDVRYGNAWLDWDMLASVCAVIGDPRRGNLAEAMIVFDQGRGRGWAQVSSLDRFRGEVQDGREVGLVHLLGEAGAFGATEKQDHVFSLVAISADKGQVDLFKTFGSAPAEVFAHTTRLSLEQDERLCALGFAGIGHERRVEGLPSWVPDYSCLPKTSPLQKTTNKRFYHASGSTKPEISIDVSLNTLSVRVLVIDQIAAASTHYLRRQPNENDASESYAAQRGPFQEEVESLSRRCAQPYQVGTSTQSRREATWRTLIGNCVHPMTMQDSLVYPAPESLANGDQAIKRLIDFESRIKGLDPSELQRERDTAVSLEEDLTLSSAYGAAEAACSQGRRFAVTEGGRMAMVPPGSMQGDLVVVILGAEMPFLLRKTESESMKLVGECYVHGLMDEEAMGLYDSATLTFT
ncbi:HET-domain-containing protein [Lophium mytilinum]|uniref:HET-domain-containing protein n=1 Tax=Lophium mytilinum TaxID=390894 RepID=A0A6A6QEY3_9PEZI|nr:HET-domain-containing protein [Lophium mytilinum]